MTSEACSIAVAIVVVGMVKNLLSYCNAIIKIVSMYYYGNILCFHFYCAMLCIRGTSRGPVSVRLSVCLSVCPSQVGVLLKRLNVGSHKQNHMQ